MPAATSSQPFTTLKRPIRSNHLFADCSDCIYGTRCNSSSIPLQSPSFPALGSHTNTTVKFVHCGTYHSRKPLISIILFCMVLFYFIGERDTPVDADWS